MVIQVLVADDSATIQKVIKIAFARLAYEIIEAISYPQAANLLNSAHPPSVVILDANLPGLQGPLGIRKLMGNNKIPVLLLVGTYDTIDEESYRQAGFSHFLRKPFESMDIVSGVEKLLPHSGAASVATATPLPGPPQFSVQKSEIAPKAPLVLSQEDHRVTRERGQVIPGPPGPPVFSGFNLQTSGAALSAGSNQPGATDPLERGAFDGFKLQDYEALPGLSPPSPPQVPARSPGPKEVPERRVPSKAPFGGGDSSLPTSGGLAFGEATLLDLVGPAQNPRTASRSSSGQAMDDVFVNSRQQPPLPPPLPQFPPSPPSPPSPEPPPGLSAPRAPLLQEGLTKEHLGRVELTAPGDSSGFAMPQPSFAAPTPSPRGLNREGLGEASRHEIRAAIESEVRNQIKEDLPMLVSLAVHEYCERHFGPLAKEIITQELRRLAEEKTRQLVDN